MRSAMIEVCPFGRGGRPGFWGRSHTLLDWSTGASLAKPMVAVGMRMATDLCVGAARLGRLIGSKGSGDAIVVRLSNVHTRLLLLEMAPADILALLLDAVIGCVEKTLSEETR